MTMLYAMLSLLLGGGFLSLACGRAGVPAPRALQATSLAASVAGVGAGGLGVVLSLRLLLQEKTLTGVLALPLPLGHCMFSIDALSAFFLLPVSLLAAVGGALLPGRLHLLAAEPGTVFAAGRHGFFFCLLIAGMVLVLTAADAVFFLVSWEMMSLMPFFLISPLDKDSKERFAAWIYLVAAHLGGLPLLLLFAGMTTEAEGSAFTLFAAHGAWLHASLYFALALVGFGLKAGLAPLHMWMPEAHASAPGHVAVLLSGAMLNTGLYGILRVLLLTGPPEAWWGYALMGIGAFSGVLGILLGLVQPDIKRTLAYSSAENMGIICLALGGALLAGEKGASSATFFLLAGAFLHIWNHSLFKSLLFLAANAVKESTRTTLIQRLGGLQKRIPFTGGSFALGAAAIAGIPPLNGLMSELLIYLGFVFGGEASGGTETTLVFWTAFFFLGGMAGMALFAFTRAYGLAFLGLPRGNEALEAREPDALFCGCMFFLAALCVCAGLAGSVLYVLIKPLLAGLVAGLALPVAFSLEADMTETVLQWYAVAGVMLLLLFAAAAFVRKWIVGKNGSTAGSTWSCGFHLPTARMQYSGGSFSRSFALLMKPLTRVQADVPRVEGLFPVSSRVVMHAPDWPATLWTRLVFHPVTRVAEFAKNLQIGLVNVYILYILFALVLALTWALGWA